MITRDSRRIGKVQSLKCISLHDGVRQHVNNNAVHYCFVYTSEELVVATCWELGMGGGAEQKLMPSSSHPIRRNEHGGREVLLS